jgi:hypothetical protein
MASVFGPKKAGNFLSEIRAVKFLQLEALKPH